MSIMKIKDAKMIKYVCLFLALFHLLLFLYLINIDQALVYIYVSINSLSAFMGWITATFFTDLLIDELIEEERLKLEEEYIKGLRYGN